MKRQEFQRQFFDFRRMVEEESRARRDPYYALERLHQFYEALDIEQRALADEAIVELVRAPTEAERFDALVLIDHYGIRAAISALQELFVCLQSIPGPAPVFESQKVARILTRLGETAY